MAKMGYVTGTGLGKNSEGRVEPVEAEVISEGYLGLDGVMELRERKRLKKTKPKKERKSVGKAEEKLEVDLFDFINTKLTSNG